MASLFDLTGKVALIIGSSRGISKAIAISKVADMQLVRNLAVFLASAAGRFMTGQTLAIDGGGTIA